MLSFHFVIFSYLFSYGGGRETWLNQFVPKLMSMLPDAQIYIYYITNDSVDETTLLQVVSAPDNARIHLVPVNITGLSGFIGSLGRMIKFWGTVVYKINMYSRNTSDDVKVVAVGSFYEGMVILLLRLLRRKKDNCSLVIWLRSIWKLQVLAIHQGFLARISVGLESVFLRSADKLIANGWDTAEAYKSPKWLDPVVIPNAVDVDKFSILSGAVLATLPYKISYIGRLSPEKGLLDFLRSVAYFNRNFPVYKDKVVFEIVGDGPLKETVLEYVLKESNLLFIGTLAQDDIPKYLSRVDVSVGLTFSSGESGGSGVSNGLLEILAARKVLICWDSPIYRQVVDRESAIMIKEHSVDGLAGSYYKLMVDQDVFIDLAKQGQKVALTFSFDRHMEKFLKHLS